MGDPKSIMQLHARGFQNFLTLHPTDVHPTISEDYSELLNTMPTRVEKAAAEKAKKDKKGNDDQEDKKDPLQAKLNSLVEETRAKGERRNSYLNLAYTAPQENTALQRNIPYSKVASVVVDMFMDTSLPPGEPPTSTAQAASVDGDVVKASIEVLPKFPSPRLSREVTKFLFA